jgi:hypothetical protein
LCPNSCANISVPFIQTLVPQRDCRGGLLSHDGNLRPEASVSVIRAKSRPPNLPPTRMRSCASQRGCRAIIRHRAAGAAGAVALTLPTVRGPLSQGDWAYVTIPVVGVPADVRFTETEAGWGSGRSGSTLGSCREGQVDTTSLDAILLPQTSDSLVVMSGVCGTVETAACGFDRTPTRPYLFSLRQLLGHLTEPCHLLP